MYVCMTVWYSVPQVLRFHLCLFKICSSASMQRTIFKTNPNNEQIMNLVHRQLSPLYKPIEKSWLPSSVGTTVYSTFFSNTQKVSMEPYDTSIHRTVGAHVMCNPRTVATCCSTDDFTAETNTSVFFTYFHTSSNCLSG